MKKMKTGHGKTLKISIRLLIKIRLINNKTLKIMNIKRKNKKMMKKIGLGKIVNQKKQKHKMTKFKNHGLLIKIKTKVQKNKSQLLKIK
jgi:hypothetical protein